MNFNFFAETVESESKARGYERSKVIRDTLDYFFDYINTVQSNSPEVTIKDIVSEVKADIQDYVDKHTTSSIRTKVIETYLNKRVFSLAKYNVNTAYKELCNEITEGKTKLKKYEDKSLQYTYNFDEDTKILVGAILAKVRKEREKIKNYVLEHEELRNYGELSKKELNSVIKNIANGNAEQESRLKQMLAFYSKSEKAIVADEFKQYTKKSVDGFKTEIMEAISDKIAFIEKYNYLDGAAKYSNVIHKSLYIYDYNFTKEEIKDSLKPSNLKKLAPEQLLALDAYWTNRLNKMLNDIHKGLFILSHPELYVCKKTSDGKTEYNVPKENLYAADLKTNLIQKLLFEEFKAKENKNDSLDMSENIKEAYRQYGRPYREYLDQKLPYTKNDLEEDMTDGLVFQNMAYNLYKMKMFDMQSLLAIMLNKEGKNITNFGYIEDGVKYRNERKFVLIGADIPGMNMPLRLHTNKDVVVEVLKQAQGNTKLPKYNGDQDFRYATGKLIPCKMYIPLSEDKKEKLNATALSSTEKDKYEKTIAHLNYISGKGKLPKHLNGKKEYIDLKEVEYER